MKAALLPCPLHTAGPISAYRARISSTIYAMVMSKFSPVFCISVFFEKGIMTLTIQNHELYASNLHYILLKLMPSLGPSTYAGVSLHLLLMCC